MAFTGTLDKCKACDKTVYVVDMLTLEGVPYHKTCFKCTHCKGNLVMSNYSSMDGVLYCKTHFEQLFKESGNYSKNFQSGKNPICSTLLFTCMAKANNIHFLDSAAKEKNNEYTKTPNKLSSMFCGTQDKCAACHKTVYPLEKMSMEGECYHKTCFRCAHGGCPLTHSSYAALNGVLYCKHHFAQLFMVKGNYAHVLQAASNKRSNSSTSQENPENPADQDD
ncbi:hypothetical protein V6N13_138089 [Hibiscus sabdariffa]|uniref:LIM zinc-binding domain-containing protein n=1 Tax=Hibiscus sabdariffa TaxID=183260 RepID=A0ABR2QCW3_9ROSI